MEQLSVLSLRLANGTAIVSLPGRGRSHPGLYRRSFDFGRGCLDSGHALPKRSSDAWQSLVADLIALVHTIRAARLVPRGMDKRRTLAPDPSYGG